MGAPSRGRMARATTVPKTRAAASQANAEMWCMKSNAEKETEITCRVVAMMVNTTGPKLLMV